MTNSTPVGKAINALAKHMYHEAAQYAESIGVEFDGKTEWSELPSHRKVPFIEKATQFVNVLVLEGIL